MSTLASLFGFRSFVKEISDDEESVGSAQSPTAMSEVKTHTKDEEKLEVESNMDDDEDDDDVGEDEYVYALSKH